VPEKQHSIFQTWQEKDEQQNVGTPAYDKRNPNRDNTGRALLPAN
jgi:hypothetical protein